MKVIKIKKGKKYRYTAGTEAVEVEYLRETNNGFVFTDGRMEIELSILSIQKYIEEATNT